MSFQQAIGEGFLAKDGSKVSGDKLAGKTIAVYVSAHWCPPCRMFTPQLADFYEQYTELDSNFEIIFASSDRSKEEMWDYFTKSHGDYLCAEYGSQALQILKELINTRGIPCLAVFKPDGTLITKEGRKAVAQGPAHVFKNGWE